MNPIDENTPTSDEQRFDLLVDGELSEAERRELLSGLDDQAGGWRRCALAFLEGQSWREALGGLAQGGAERPPAARLSRWFRLGGPGGTLLAMAASFLAAMVLVGFAQGIWRSESPAVAPSVTAVALSEGPKTQASHAGRAEGNSLAVGGQPEAASPETWVLVPGWEGPAGQGQPVRLFAVESKDLSEDWVDALPTAMSPEILESLNQAGLRVERRRELLPLRSGDGQRLVVPVEEVDIRYVGRPTL
jgi:hypothetical protein